MVMKVVPLPKKNMSIYILCTFLCGAVPTSHVAGSRAAAITKRLDPGCRADAVPKKRDDTAARCLIISVSNQKINSVSI